MLHKFWNDALVTILKAPDFTVHHKGHQTPYLTRWWLIPRNRWLNVYLHKYEESDLIRALHDHEYFSVSVLLRGELMEHTLNGRRCIPRFLPVFRSAKLLHRLQLIKGPAFTVFITGPRVRKWGFYYKGQWLPYDVYFKKFGMDSDYTPVAELDKRIHNNWLN